MTNEASDRSAGKADSGNDAGRYSGQHSALQTRAAFLKNWNWQLIVGFNRAVCERGRAQFGYNSETQADVRAHWESIQPQALTLQQTFDFLRDCHKSAPFLSFNGNTFAEVARRTVDVLLADLSSARRRTAASLAAHYVAGVLDAASLSHGLESIMESASFQAGDRVHTLKGSLKGIVRRILPDGRVLWQPNGKKDELIALPESLLRERKKKRAPGTSEGV